MDLRRVGIAAVACALTSAVTPTGAVDRALPIDTLPRYGETHFNFVTLGVADANRALEFYETVLGMHERGRAQPDLRHFEIVVGFDDRPTTPGISLKYLDGPPMPRGNGSSALNLVVSDLARRLANVERLGGRITLPYFRRESATLSYGYAVIEDPDGNAIELVEYLRLPKPGG